MGPLFCKCGKTFKSMNAFWNHISKCKESNKGCSVKVTSEAQLKQDGNLAAPLQAGETSDVQQQQKSTPTQRLQQKRSLSQLLEQPSQEATPAAQPPIQAVNAQNQRNQPLQQQFMIQRSLQPDGSQIQLQPLSTQGNLSLQRQGAMSSMQLQGQNIQMNVGGAQPQNARLVSQSQPDLNQMVVQQQDLNQALNVASGNQPQKSNHLLILQNGNQQIMQQQFQNTGITQQNLNQSQIQQAMNMQPVRTPQQLQQLKQAENNDYRHANKTDKKSEAELKKYSCEICVSRGLAVAYKTKQGLCQHRTSQHTERRVCGLKGCQLTFSSPSTFNRHRSVFHEKSVSVISKRRVVDSKYRVKCDGCGNDYATEGYLTRHLRSGRCAKGTKQTPSSDSDTDDSF